MWMKNHLVIDKNCNTVKPRIPQNILQEMTKEVGLTINSVGDTTPQFTISIEQDN